MSIPAAMVPEKAIPMTVSLDREVFSERKAISRAIIIDTAIDDSDRSRPSKAPTAMPAKAECEIASEKNDILRSTAKFPTKGQSMPTINEARRALWIKGYDRNSLIVFMATMYVCSHHFSVDALDNVVCQRLLRLAAAYELPVHADDVVCKTVNHV